MQAKSVAQRKGDTNAVCALRGSRVAAVADVITAPSNSTGRIVVVEQDLLWPSDLRLAKGIVVD